MAYQLRTPQEQEFMRKFNASLQDILQYKSMRGGSLEDAYQAVTGEPWMEGRSVKLKGGRPEMTKDRTFGSVMGKYVAPIAGTAAALFGVPGLFPGLLGGGGGAASSAAGASTLLGEGGIPAGLSTAGMTPGLIGEAATGAGTAAAGKVAADAAKKKGLLGRFGDFIQTPGGGALTGAGLSALGGTLSALASPPSFQERRPAGEMPGFSELGKRLQNRPPIDFSRITAQNPMEGMANDPNEEVRQILSRLR